MTVLFSMRRTIPTPFVRVSIVLLTLTAPLRLHAQSVPTLQVDAIEVAGARRYTQAEVAMISGLEIGKRIPVAELDAVTKRMAETGLFKRLDYRYSQVDPRNRVVNVKYVFGG